MKKKPSTDQSCGVADFSITVGTDRTERFWLGSEVTQYPDASNSFRTPGTPEHNIIAAYTGLSGGPTANDFPN
jgi:hypothetical protein